jgi:hypothetical protein
MQFFVVVLCFSVVLEYEIPGAAEDSYYRNLYEKEIVQK